MIQFRKIGVRGVARIGAAMLAFGMLAQVTVQATCNICQSTYRSIQMATCSYSCYSYPKCDPASYTSSCYPDSGSTTVGVTCYDCDGFQTTVQAKPCHSDDGCNPDP